MKWLLRRALSSSPSMEGLTFFTLLFPQWVSAVIVLYDSLIVPQVVATRNPIYHPPSGTKRLQVESTSASSTTLPPTGGLTCSNGTPLDTT